MKLLYSLALAVALLAGASFTSAKAAEDPVKAVGFGVVGAASALAHIQGPIIGAYGITMIVGCEIAYKTRGTAHPWCGDGKKMAALDFDRNPHEAVAVPAMNGVNVVVDRTVPVYPLSEFGKMLARINGVDSVAIAQKQ